ncbi:MAG: Fur family transcriptional regulator [Alphaproteobacteria bacterium]|jgi:Fur family transcriptional regulator, iron response regulator|nr:transcriptional repressor [Rhodospirillaceae bacterium]MBT6512186.1 transcriptional repressor [Rhodospirillaceae bacterium]MBT7614919.1 transcriptional repressor [Rhodospirillaceae bacterium]MDG2481719.1 Fur family transcriptional regulator [Alphaproteobacteria bacterium]
MIKIDSTAIETLRQRLRAAGLRPTRQREELAGLLFRDGNRHVTAEVLHREAIQDDAQVSLATVYNTLHQFTRAGLLREVVVDSGRAYFDTHTGPHHHFFNTVSQELTDIPADRVLVVDLPAPPTGTQVDGVEVVIRVTPQNG